MSAEESKKGMFSVIETIFILGAVVLVGIFVVSIVAGDIRFSPIG